MIGTFGSNTPECLADRTIISSERPSNPTRRSEAWAARNTLWTRATLLAKQATTTRPFNDVTSFTKASPTSPSVGDLPGVVAFVESQITASIPFAARAFHVLGDHGDPMTGRASIFQSAVCKIRVPCDSSSSAQVSGVECVMGSQVTSNEPMVCVSPGKISINGAGGGAPRQAAFFRRTAAANGVA